jgi:hypothetical protein
MSSTSLFIGYARSTCDRAQVQTVLEPLVGVMDRIDETTRKDSKGYDYKMFFIHFTVTNPELDSVIARIKREDFINIVYDTQWDKRKWNDETHSYGAQVPRFWKVTLYVKKDKPVVAPVSMPHIMSAQEVALIRTPKHDDDSQHDDAGASRRRKRNSA